MGQHQGTGTNIVLRLVEMTTVIREEASGRRT